MCMSLFVCTSMCNVYVLFMLGIYVLLVLTVALLIPDSLFSDKGNRVVFSLRVSVYLL